MIIKRCQQNPVVVPGIYEWRKATVFNPAVIYENNQFFMLERATGGLDPFQCSIGLLQSDDGIHFKHVQDKPVLDGEMLGLPYASLQDPRIVKIEDIYYMNYAIRPYSYSCNPTGVGLPNYWVKKYADWSGKAEDNLTRSAIATSKDMIHWEFLCYTTPANCDDRDNVLFPEKINGRFVLLRRPNFENGERPSMWISYSDNLIDWDDMQLLASAEYEWEGEKIGASTPPIKTDKGWLVLYHGVDKKSVYRVGALLLDLENPQKILARTKDFIMEPQEYYEKFGLVLPNVIFPTGNIVKDGILYIYYGCCDTSIALATIPVDELLSELLA